VCGGDGLCEPLSCEAGYTCAEGSECVHGAPASDAHGCRVLACDEPGATPCPVTHGCSEGSCVRLACNVDDDCPCGTCMESQCWDRPWICVDVSGL
jgi:hypothetical protein